MAVSPGKDTEASLWTEKGVCRNTIQSEDKRATANCFSISFLCWLSPLISRAAKKKSLDIADCWRHGEFPDALAAEYAELYEKAMKTEAGKKKRPTLLRMLRQMDRGDLCFGALMHGLMVGLQILHPIFLNQTVRFVELSVLYDDVATCKASASSFDMHLCNRTVIPILLPILFACALFVESTLLAKSTQANLRFALRCRTICVGAISRKFLRLSSIGKGSSSTGSINNLIANDVQQFIEIAAVMHYAWSSPFFFLASFVLLYFAVGFAFLGGVGVMLVCMPGVFLLIRKLSAVRKLMLLVTDKRLKLLADVISSMRVIKAYGWEMAMSAKVSEIRDIELAHNKRRALLVAAMMAFIFSTPTLIAVTTFSVYAASGTEFTASRIFTALAAMNAMKLPLLLGPFLAVQFINLLLSAKRIEAFLDSDEVPLSVVDRQIPLGFSGKAENANSEVTCVLRDVDAAWAVPEKAPSEDKDKGKERCGCFGRLKRSKGKGDAGSDSENIEDSDTGKNIVSVTKNGRDFECTQILTGINFQAPKGKLTAIVGQVGSGKSSLVHSLLGDMEIMKGEVDLRGTVAYVSQQAIIFNATIKENITLSKQSVLEPKEEEFYNQVLKGCCLAPDISILPGGDLTEVGERGVTLSGGQKQRVSLARAVFSRSDIVIMDDPLSALDVHVGKSIAEGVIADGGMLDGRTRILVTQQVQFLGDADNIYCIKDGMVQREGDFSTLFRDGYFGTQSVALREEKEGEADEVVQDKSTKKIDLQLDKTMQLGSLIQDEERGSGWLELSVLTRYVRAGGACSVTAWVIGMLLYQTAEVCTQSWLATWAGGKGMGVNQERDQRPLGFYVGIYCALGISQAVFLFIRTSILTCVVTKKAAAKLHGGMVWAVLRAKSSFFDETPQGRIMNRFSTDINFVDEKIEQTISQFANCLMNLCGCLFVICTVYPPLIILAIIILVLFYTLTDYYRHSSRELQRLELVTLSPVYTLLNETLHGLSTIRGYGIGQLIVTRLDAAMDITTGIKFLMKSGTAWLQIRLKALNVTMVVFVTTAPMVIPLDHLSAGFIALAITYSFDMGLYMQWGAQVAADLEQRFIGIARILDYTDNIAPEAEWILTEEHLTDAWPKGGSVSMTNVELRYRPTLEPALKGVSFEINNGEKVGIVGRTGSGKSTLIVALLRMAEFDGTIKIDGVDISLVGLHTLRQRITMIPQDPVVFGGTLRSNLDPLELEKSDVSLQSSIDHVCLREEVDRLGGLDHQVAEGGTNFSVGQRQLIGIARAILRRSPLVLLDEATANVDHQTDEIIQKAIRNEFEASTVLTIAHRLNTVLDSDRILVMAAGKVSELGTPQELAQDSESLFRSLLQGAGLLESVLPLATPEKQVNVASI
eukprot:TRINITY_DN26508_c0_g1_i1.p1 TRINITY_DN26508_c0_g1~~TRINITY_DN26508_c0_g1_i1.p1  ORF type:complete len:1381 (+),score=229.47 TRINITY_DN26508_c0_g1_i1:141-4283(+)